MGTREPAPVRFRIRPRDALAELLSDPPLVDRVRWREGLRPFGVIVPDGKGKLELRYWPDDLTHGFLAGLVGLVLFALGIYLTSRSSRRSSSRWARPRRDQTL